VEEHVVGWGEFALDVVFAEPELGEEGLVEEAALGFGRGFVHRLDVGGELQGVLEVEVDRRLIA
jgi:hypothetical protein